MVLGEQQRSLLQAPAERIFSGLVVALLVVCSVPFLNQALHIDDQVFLMGADIVARTPLRPHAATVDLFGDQVPWIRANQHPPGLPYYLALVRGISGASSEPAMHLWMLPFWALLLLATWKLARELGVHPGWATLAVACAAPVVVSAHTLMTDVPLAALFHASLYALLRAHHTRRPGWVLVAVLLCACTWFMQYRGFLLVLVGPALLWQARGAREPAARPWLVPLLVLGSVPALFLAWCGWNLWEMGKLHFFDASGMIDYSVERLALSTTAMLAYTGGTVGPLALVALWTLRRRRRSLVGLLVGSAVLATVLPVLMPHQTPGPRLAGAALAFLGALLLGGCALAAWLAEDDPRAAGAGRGGRLLALLVLGLLSVQCVVSLFACARMLLLVLPLAFIALLRAAPADRTGRRLLGACLAVNLLLALAYSWADTAHADAYREVAPRVARLASAGPGRGWFMGEWGLRNYLEAEGLTYLRGNDARPRRGDHVVVPSLNCPSPLHPDLKRRLGPPRTITVPGRSIMRLMDPALGAGYYTDGYGVLPMSLTHRDRPYDTLKIYPVVR